jgi:hypothetical protein
VEVSVKVHSSRYGFFLAIERDGRYEAPMTPEGKKLTGCSAVCGSADYVASSPNVRTYPTIIDATAALRRMVDGDDQEYLYGYDSGECLRRATAEESTASKASAIRDGGAGVIVVDGRACYVR